ncbi:hypothetical protein MGYG_00513 [Nannizzia gypsea CBS 118893]|uniref:Uncharacterized protein n=1 Tax=Arthroderma gypseum (strain ATCC MYA-4604 / CBS 118893) TaxID=535722 RepID=E5R061_ARTGP|nr:hypothetical protein MGYG_00513 [Nannizzia gypsea CBS 118893]EFQ97472.1 hypothetical protein MGYG_00513 [Nannizzia gypsea CBS 118893]
MLLFTGEDRRNGSKSRPAITLGEGVAKWSSARDRLQSRSTRRNKHWELRRSRAAEGDGGGGVREPFRRVLDRETWRSEKEEEERRRGRGGRRRGCEGDEEVKFGLAVVFPFLALFSFFRQPNEGEGASQGVDESG